MSLYSIPGKLEGEWNADAKAVVDTWTNYVVSLDDFKKAVLETGVPYAKANGGQAWIVDSSTARGAFPQDIQAFIGSDVFPAFTANGIKYFITITPESAVTKMSVSSYASKAGPGGLQLVEVASVDDAVAWLKANA